MRINISMAVFLMDSAHFAKFCLIQPTWESILWMWFNTADIQYLPIVAICCPFFRPRILICFMVYGVYGYPRASKEVDGSCLGCAPQLAPKGSVERHAAEKTQLASSRIALKVDRVDRICGDGNMNIPFFHVLSLIYIYIIILYIYYNKYYIKY